MARGRVIDKLFYCNEDVGSLPIEVRYFYLGTIVHADDEGRLKADPRVLKALIYPFDDATRIDTIKKWRDDSVSAHLITLYAAGGKEYLCHPNWEKWQPIRKDRITPSDCPAPDNQLSTNCQPDARMLAAQPNLTKPNLTQGAPRAREAFRKPSLEEITAYCKERGSPIDPEQFFAHYESNGWRVGKNLMKSWVAAIVTWEKNNNGRVAKEAPSGIKPWEEKALAQIEAKR